jgi:hypothetical protein
MSQQRIRSPRYEARVQAQKHSSHRATAVQERPREAPQRPASRPAPWNTAPVLDPLVELYRR